jgi:hypothetical protein
MNNETIMAERKRDRGTKKEELYNDM